ncbi:MAG: hypothetical protein GY797_01560 [Deltaproteobacteria bacterium]|nr:hypothetical protein [Deltaproteobacteria bacterium]
MKKILLILIAVFFLVPQVWAATYNIGPGQTYETFAALLVGETITDNDIVDGGGNTFREEWNLPTNTGSSGNPVILQNATILGSDDFIGVSGDWVDQGSNVWRKNIGTTEPLVVTFNTALRGVNDATPASAGEWTYSSPNLDVYSETNPATYYTAIEAAQRGRCVNIIGASYATIKNITGKTVNNDVFSFNDTSEVHIENCGGYYADAATNSNVFTSHDSAIVTGNNIIAKYCEIAVAFVGASATIDGMVISDSSIGFDPGTGIHIYKNYTVTDCVSKAIRSSGTTSGNTALLVGGEVRNCDKVLSTEGTTTLELTINGLTGYGSDNIAIHLSGANTTTKIYNLSLQHNANSNGIYAAANTNLELYNSAIDISTVRYALYVDATATYTGDYNYFNSASGNVTWHNSNCTTIAAHRTAFSADANSDFIDPEFLSSGKILKTSPCIDTGAWIDTINNTGTADPWGKYVHKIPNIGADQGAGAPKGGGRMLLTGNKL